MGGTPWSATPFWSPVENQQCPAGQLQVGKGITYADLGTRLLKGRLIVPAVLS